MPIEWWMEKELYNGAYLDAAGNPRRYTDGKQDKLTPEEKVSLRKSLQKKAASPPGPGRKPPPRKPFTIPNLPEGFKLPDELPPHPGDEGPIASGDKSIANPFGHAAKSEPEMNEWAKKYDAAPPGKKPNSEAEATAMANAAEAEEKRKRSDITATPDDKLAAAAKEQGPGATKSRAANAATLLSGAIDWATTARGFKRLLGGALAVAAAGAAAYYLGGKSEKEGPVPDGPTSAATVASSVLVRVMKGQPEVYQATAELSKSFTESAKRSGGVAYPGGQDAERIHSHAIADVTGDNSEANAGFGLNIGDEVGEEDKAVFAGEMRLVARLIPGLNGLKVDVTTKPKGDFFDRNVRGTGPDVKRVEVFNASMANGYEVRVPPNPNREDFRRALLIAAERYRSDMRVDEDSFASQRQAMRRHSDGYLGDAMPISPEEARVLKNPAPLAGGLMRMLADRDKFVREDPEYAAFVVRQLRWPVPSKKK